MKKVAVSIAGIMTFTATAFLSAQSALPPPFPRQNATKLLETEKIVVWDIVWPKGQPTAMHRHPHDQVGTYYARGGRIITQPDGSKREGTTEVGNLSTTRKGTTHIEEGATDPPLRAVFIELLQDKGPASPPADTNRMAETGAKQVLDDDRVAVWDGAWKPGALKYHADRDTVIVWLDSGKVRTTNARGMAITTEVNAGTMRYLAHGSAEIFEMAEGSPRTMFFQIK